MGFGGKSPKSRLNCSSEDLIILRLICLCVPSVLIVIWFVIDIYMLMLHINQSENISAKTNSRFLNRIGRKFHDEALGSIQRYYSIVSAKTECHRSLVAR